jgi:hypothetical protein
MQLVKFVGLALSVIPFALCADVDSASSARPSSKTKYWFSFGDSYTSTGFIANGTQPSPANPFGYEVSSNCIT